MRSDTGHHIIWYALLDNSLDVFSLQVCLLHPLFLSNKKHPLLVLPIVVMIVALPTNCIHSDDLGKFYVSWQILLTLSCQTPCKIAILPLSWKRHKITSGITTLQKHSVLWEWSNQPWYPFCSFSVSLVIDIINEGGLSTRAMKLANTSSFAFYFVFLSINMLLFFTKISCTTFGNENHWKLHGNHFPKPRWGQPPALPRLSWTHVLVIGRWQNSTHTNSSLSVTVNPLGMISTSLRDGQMLN